MQVGGQAGCLKLLCKAVDNANADLSWDPTNNRQWSLSTLEQQRQDVEQHQLKRDQVLSFSKKGKASVRLLRIPAGGWLDPLFDVAALLAQPLTVPAQPVSQPVHQPAECQSRRLWQKDEDMVALSVYAKYQDRLTGNATGNKPSCAQHVAEIWRRFREEVTEKLSAVA